MVVSCWALNVGLALGPCPFYIHRSYIGGAVCYSSPRLHSLISYIYFMQTRSRSRLEKFQIDRLPVELRITIYEYVHVQVIGDLYEQPIIWPG